MAEPDPPHGDDPLGRTTFWLNRQEGYSLVATPVATERFGLTPQDQQDLVETVLPGADD